MKIENLYNEITSITNSKQKQSFKERDVVNRVQEYSSANKISFEETLEQLDDYVKSLKLNAKAITVKQPWASLICAGIKDIENRTWKTSYRGRVYIHTASKGEKSAYGCLTVDQRRELLNTPIASMGFKQLPTSAIIGHVDIVDCVINHSSIWAEKTPRYLSGLNMKLFEQMEGIKPIYNWVLANPVLFDKPIFEVKGKLSFWDCSAYFTHQTESIINNE